MHLPGLEINLTKGNVFRNLIVFAIPFLISNLIQSMYIVADMLIVGRFVGTEAMSGVNIGGNVTFILTNTVIGLSVGATVLIGQYIGSGNREQLKKVTATIITLLAILGIGITVIILFVRVPILKLLQTPAESFAESETYLTVTVTGLIFIFGYNALAAILRGMGDSRSPLYFVAVAGVANIALDFLFIVVFKWGMFGVGVASIISQALSVALCIVYIKKRNFQFDFRLSSFKIDAAQLREILRIGFPTCIQNSIVSISFLFITAIINVIGGVTASAAVGAVGRFNGFVFMPVFALSSSVATMSAQNFGAGKLERASQACRYGILMAIAVSYTFFAFVQIFPEAVLILFGDDPKMISDGVTYLRSFSFDFLLIPFVFCLNGLFIGGGHTMFTLFNSVLSSVLLRAPISYIFGNLLGWGIFGAGMAAPIASFGSLILIIGFLISGRWKRNVVKTALPETG